MHKQSVVSVLINTNEYEKQRLTEIIFSIMIVEMQPKGLNGTSVLLITWLLWLVGRLSARKPVKLHPTPVGWLLLLQLTVLSRSEIVV